MLFLWFPTRETRCFSHVWFVSLSQSELVIMEGYLNKKSPKAVFGMRAWQQRYFILYTDRLLYKKTQDDQSDTGMAATHSRHRVLVVAISLRWRAWLQERFP